MVWYSYLLKNFSQFVVIHTVKGFGIVNKAEIDVFLELSCFFDDPADVGNWISASSAFSKTSLNIREFTVHVLLKPGLDNVEHYFTAAVHWVTKSGTRLSDFTFTFHFHALEKEMAIHSGVLAWRIPRMERPGGLLSMGLHTVRND